MYKSVSKSFCFLLHPPAVVLKLTYSTIFFESQCMYFTGYGNVGRSCGTSLDAHFLLLGVAVFSNDHVCWQACKSHSKTSGEASTHGLTFLFGVAIMSMCLTSTRLPSGATKPGISTDITCGILQSSKSLVLPSAGISICTWSAMMSSFMR